MSEPWVDSTWAALVSMAMNSLSRSAFLSPLDLRLMSWKAVMKSVHSLRPRAVRLLRDGVWSRERGCEHTHVSSGSARLLCKGSRQRPYAPQGSSPRHQRILVSGRIRIKER